MTDTLNKSGTVVRLILTELGQNHNKFWHGKVEGTTVYCEWGRVGDLGQSKSYAFTTLDDAEQFLERKKNEKLRKGYTEQFTIADNMATPNTKSHNIRHIAKTQIEHNDPETASLIDFLVQRNIHAIEGATSIRLEHGVLTTPLGPVTSEGLDKADALLASMADPKVADFNSLADQYLRIVPRAIGRRKVDPYNLFGSADKISNEKTLLDSLRAVLDDAEQKASSDVPVVFQTRLALLDDSSPEFKKLIKLFTTSINKQHQSSKMKLHKAWEMSIASADKAFEYQLGNIMWLWHGTKDANLLSILKNGYVIASNRGRGSIQITGRMFGDGIYFSDQSTKSLNYATNFWGGQGSQRCFMLMNDVAMGKAYTPPGGYGGFRGLPSGYDSTWAKAGKSGVMNNEMIVYRTSQIKPRYLCEFR